MLDNIELELLGNYLLNELSKCVKQYNRPEYLEGIISRYIWLGYNNRNWLLKVSGPIL